jgi:hypothetical protein
LWFKLKPYADNASLSSRLAASHWTSVWLNAVLTDGELPFIQPAKGTYDELTHVSISIQITELFLVFK